MKDTLQFKGNYTLHKKLVTGEIVYIGEYSNIITKTLKDSILNTVAQVSGGGTEIDSSFFMQYIAVGLQHDPSPASNLWYNIALTAIGTVVDYAHISTVPAGIQATATGVKVVFNAIYANSSGVIKNIDFLAGVYATGSAVAGNIFSVCGLSDVVPVADGENLIITYDLSFVY